MTPHSQIRTTSQLVGFVAGTPLLTPEGSKWIEELRPVDVLRVRPANRVRSGRRAEPAIGARVARRGDVVWGKRSC
jgi:hypothetical protein